MGAVLCGASTVVKQEPTVARLAAVSGVPEERLLHWREDRLDDLMKEHKFVRAGTPAVL
jgi:hypothetical protein